MPQPTAELNTKQQKALESLLTAPTHEAAAKAAGISTPTLWRYMKEDAFTVAYRVARREAVSLSIAHLQRAGGLAVATLVNVARDTNATPGARVAAAKCILDLSMKSIELEDLQVRVEQLEVLSKVKP